MSALIQPTDGLIYLADLERVLRRVAKKHRLTWVRSYLEREPHPRFEEVDVLVGVMVLGRLMVDVRLQACTEGCHVSWALSHQGNEMGDSSVVPTTKEVAPHVVSSVQHAFGHLGVRGMRGACSCGGRHA